MERQPESECLTGEIQGRVELESVLSRAQGNPCAGGRSILKRSSWHGSLERRADQVRVGVKAVETLPIHQGEKRYVMRPEGAEIPQ